MLSCNVKAMLYPPPSYVRLKTNDLFGYYKPTLEHTVRYAANITMRG